MRRRIATIVLTSTVTLTAISFGLTYLSGNIAVFAASASDAGTWTTVTTLKGDGNKPEDTDPFSVHGGKVRFKYTVEHNSTGPVPFLCKMFRKGTPVSVNALAQNSCVSCDGPQINDLRTVPAGTYYLHVITSRPWNMTIEESK